MHIDTKLRLASLFYLIVAYAIALPLMALFTDLVITGSIIDIWRDSYSFAELLSFRKNLFPKIRRIRCCSWLFLLAIFL